MTFYAGTYDGPVESDIVNRITGTVAPFIIRGVIGNRELKEFIPFPVQIGLSFPARADYYAKGFLLHGNTIYIGCLQEGSTVFLVQYYFHPLVVYKSVFTGFKTAFDKLFCCGS
jgi:hypothetical protein